MFVKRAVDTKPFGIKCWKSIGLVQDVTYKILSIEKFLVIFVKKTSARKKKPWEDTQNLEKTQKEKNHK